MAGILNSSGTPIWSINENGKLVVQEIETGKLKVGSSEKPIGVTLYDKATGQANCVSLQNGTLIVEVGECTSAISNQPSATGQSVPSVSSGEATTTIETVTTTETTAVTETAPAPAPAPELTPEPAPSSGTSSN